MFHHNGAIGIVEALCMFAAETRLAIRTGSCHKSLNAPPRQATVWTDTADTDVDFTVPTLQRNAQNLCCICLACLSLDLSTFIGLNLCFENQPQTAGLQT